MTEDKTILTAEQVDTELANLTGWAREGTMIYRDFTMANFKDITDFLNHLVDAITEQNHHPDFSLDTGTRTISVRVTMHSELALTRVDVVFAQTLNQWQPNA